MCNDSGQSAGPSIHYQQIYAAEAFAGPISINHVRFFREFTADSGSDNVLGGHYTLSLSTTPKSIDSLSFPLNDNVGPDSTLFFSGVLGDPIITGHFDIFGAAFEYDPSVGNLLLDVVVTDQPNVPNGSGNGYLDATEFAPWHMRRIALIGPNIFGVNDTLSLVTAFNPESASVPEPSAAVFLISGVCLFVALPMAGRVNRRCQ
jgi:hypothetical protein